MKFAVRLVLLAIFALALSVGLVSAQEDTSVGTFVQAANEFTLELVEENTYTLNLSGVSFTTPISGEITGGLPTADLLADWLATETALSATLRFQFGNPDGELYDITLTGTVIPNAVTLFATPREFDGVANYTLVVNEDGFFGNEITGTSPGSTTVVELDEKEIVDELLGDAYTSGDDLLYVSVYVEFDSAFAESLAQARIDRLSGARPSSTGGSCLPGFTCK